MVGRDGRRPRSRSGRFWACGTLPCTAATSAVGVPGAPAVDGQQRASQGQARGAPARPAANAAHGPPEDPGSASARPASARPRCRRGSGGARPVASVVPGGSEDQPGQAQALRPARSGSCQQVRAADGDPALRDWGGAPGSCDQPSPHGKPPNGQRSAGSDLGANPPSRLPRPAARPAAAAAAAGRIASTANITVSALRPGRPMRTRPRSAPRTAAGGRTPGRTPARSGRIRAGCCRQRASASSAGPAAASGQSPTGGKAAARGSRPPARATSRACQVREAGRWRSTGRARQRLGRRGAPGRGQRPRCAVPTRGRMRRHVFPPALRAHLRA